MYYKKSSYKGKTARRVKKVRAGMKNIVSKVNYLSRRIAQQNAPILLGRSASLNISAPLISYGIDQYNSMSTVFGTASNDAHCNRAIDKSDVMDINVALSNGNLTETQTCNFTCYLVQLKDAIGTNYTSTGALTLTSGVHYQTAPFTGANALLNLKYFRIIKTKKFILTNYGGPLATSTGNTQDTYKRWTWKIKRNALIQNPEGDFSARPPMDPSQARFLIVFCDDQSTDNESPVFQVNHVKSMIQIA